MQINRYDAEGLRHEMEENGELVSFIFRDREVVAEESQAGRIRYIRTGELLASDAEYARTYYHYASDEMGSITHVVAGEWKETAATWQDNGSALTEEWKKSALAGQGNVSILAGQDNKTVESGEVPENSILNRYEYDAWGNLTICDETVSNRFRFNGQQYDPVSQQYYLRARYYNPVIGRFTQEDTYRGDGLNLYAYCRNNPVCYVDPSGHMTCEQAQEQMRRALAANQDIRGIDPTIASQLKKWYQFKNEHNLLTSDERYLAGQIGLDVEGGSDTTRVGRWMSQEEYDKMISSGKVQMSGDNKVHVANPADINAFGRQAPKGSIYVEFDVPSNTISRGGQDGWGIINGPGSLLDRVNAKKGLPRITEMPDATNISIEGRK